MPNTKTIFSGSAPGNARQLFPTQNLIIDFQEQ